MGGLARLPVSRGEYHSRRASKNSTRCDVMLCRQRNDVAAKTNRPPDCHQTNWLMRGIRCQDGSIWSKIEGSKRPSWPEG